MSEPPDSFADHPPTIGELRSDKDHNAAKWAPRDALITALRDIDSGKLKPEALVIVYRETQEPDKFGTGHITASPDVHVTLGMLAYVMNIIARRT